MSHLDRACARVLPSVDEVHVIQLQRATERHVKVSRAALGVEGRAGPPAAQSDTSDPDHKRFACAQCCRVFNKRPALKISTNNHHVDEALAKQWVVHEDAIGLKNTGAAGGTPLGRFSLLV